MRPKLDPTQIDARIAALAARQHGVVTIAELLALGLSRSGIARRVRAGRLHPIHRGVYAVGHAGLTADGFRLAAVLACGEGAALSHHSAAAELGVRPRRGGLIDVTVPTRHGRTAPRGVRLHRTTHLPDHEVISRGRLRLTVRCADLRGLLGGATRRGDRTHARRRVAAPPHQLGGHRAGDGAFAPRSGAAANGDLAARAGQRRDPDEGRGAAAAARAGVHPAAPGDQRAARAVGGRSPVAGARPGRRGRDPRERPKAVIALIAQALRIGSS